MEAYIVHIHKCLCIPSLVVPPITYSKGRRDVKHHFIHLFCRPSVPSWSVYSDQKWLTILEGLSSVAFQTFAFHVLPLSSQSRKVYGKKQEKKKTCL